MLREHLDAELRVRFASLRSRLSQQEGRQLQAKAAQVRSEGKVAPTKGAATVGLEGESILDRTLREGVVSDAVSVTQNFGENVDMLAGHVDELSGAFEVSDDSTNLVYEVLAKLLRKAVSPLRRLCVCDTCWGRVSAGYARGGGFAVARTRVGGALAALVAQLFRQL